MYAQHLQFSLDQIKLATDNFSEEKLIGRGGFGKVYSGKLSISGDHSIVAMKRLDRAFQQGKPEFMTEIQMLTACRHTNIIRLVGSCDESDEMILVYEFAKNGSLDKCLSSSKLSWKKRLQISIGAAHGLCYLHNSVGRQHRILHGDIKSANILLNENYEAKVSDFGLSKVGLSDGEFTYVIAPASGTLCYIDPQYATTNVLTKESDVYSFGVVLFEILCGTLATKKIDPNVQNQRHPLLAKRYFEQNILAEIIHPDLRTQMKVDSLDMFARVAYRCLNEDRSQRPPMAWIVEKLEKAWELEIGINVPKFVRVGPWGGQNGDSENNWSFELEQDQRLSTIEIDHGDVIYSLKFTSKSSEGGVQTSDKFGGCARRDPGYEIKFDDDEEIISINGTIGTRDGYTVVSSLYFVTNKDNYGPFGQLSDSPFYIPWHQGSLVGFYGFAGHYIDRIGVYVKPHEEIMRVGTWGMTQPSSPRTHWSFQLPKNHFLKRIDLKHGEQIMSLQMIYDTERGGSSDVSSLAAGWIGGVILEQIKLGQEEEIRGIEGTFGDAKGDEHKHLTVITSLSFLTNKRNLGPYGDRRGTHFEVQWDVGSFVGFYCSGGYFIDNIGVYLKVTK